MLKSVGTERLNEVRKTLHFGRANRQDILVLEKLERGPVPKLAVDAFAGLLCKENERLTDDTTLRLPCGLDACLFRSGQNQARRSSEESD